MGVHHFELILVPISFLDLHPDFKEGSWSEDQIEQLQSSNSGCWAYQQPSEQVLGSLRKLLPINHSWDDVEEYRSEYEWGSDIRIWKDANGVVWNITFRYSPAGDNILLLRRFLEIAQHAGCMLYEPESSRIIKPEYQEVFAFLEMSSAVRFLSDPKGVLMEASEIQKKTS